ncbi:elongation factor P 5-aminopentanone reductase [Alkalicoccobacillus murimartini]|uniref:3-oxoacyl-[acyl-carrier protein] reductase n=1 Tax=Alkalicoccobacillus murimartini TaxID=171685 RepID=A0ABT9YFJ8_9BACI|nr:SDR family oxidoreductase [Alkalicoccobacillus murimartini]MDQ0206280.1 3-oxoacyl-[acyl-carrier protein] reductase [Alkalicoccobacillus murimartini]
MSVANAHILITGASGDIGSAIAKKIAKPGVTMYLHYCHHKESVEQTQQDCVSQGADAVIIQADLSHEHGSSRLLEQVAGSIDILIHTAGHSLEGLLTDVGDQELSELMTVHLLNPIKITRQLLPAMIRKQSGKIIAITSIWGVTGASYEVAYSAAKGGMNSFVKGLAKEVAPSGIQVNAVAPGAIDTKMMQTYNSEDLRLIKEEIPAGKLGSPEDIANAVEFLASSGSSYINGQIIEINGAWH